MRTLCIYATHEYSFNLDFFIKHGIYEDPSIDYCIVLNDLQMKLVVPGVTVINRENKNLDFGAWGHVLFSDKFNYKNYDYFVLLNSTVRGPFLPTWQKDKNWLKLFTDRLDDEIKLVGTTIGWCHHPPHVQSMLLTLDKIGMELVINGGIFDFNKDYGHDEIIVQREVGISQLILNSGYNIACMLKALHGIDFRQNRDSTPHTFFWRSKYFGIDVHPFEVIFIKTTTLVGNCELSPTIHKITAWHDHPADINWKDFDWRLYVLSYEDLWLHGVRTESAAINHYQTHGYYESRLKHGTVTPGRFFTVELGTDLAKQLIGLVNAIIIGHYTNRTISIRNFYSKTIDINRLNVLIAGFGLMTQITLNGQFQRREKYEISSNDYMQLLYDLRSQKSHALDLRNTYSNIFETCPDTDIQEIYRKLLINLPFTRKIVQMSEIVQNSLELIDYGAVHLNHRDAIDSYLVAMKNTFNQNDQIFIKTCNLGEIQTLFPNIKASSNHEIIDYLIYRKCKAFIGSSDSDLSKILFYHCMNEKIPFIDCSGYLIDPLNDPYTILYAKVGHGKIGLNGQLGHSSYYQGVTTETVHIDETDLFTISAHAPSEVIIETKQEMNLRGYCSPTSVNTPVLTFICDDQTIGTTNNSGEKTASITLQPGKHALKVETSTIGWAHSVWLFKSPDLG